MSFQEARRLRRAWHLGMIAKWSRTYGYISTHDPTTGTWHDLQIKDAPDWAKGESATRKSLYRAGEKHAYNLTSAQMEEIWESEQPQDEGIVEEYPVEDGERILEEE